MLLKLISFARYYEKLEKIKVIANIAEPILNIEILQEKIELEVSSKTNNGEFFFTMKNYKEENNVRKLTDVDLEFCIEIEVTDKNFPIECKIYDCNNEKEIVETEKMKVTKDKELESKYKVVIFCNENMNNKNSEISDVNINIKVNGKYNYTEKIQAFSLKRKKLETKKNIPKTQEEYIEPSKSIETIDITYNPIIEIEKGKNKNGADINYIIERVN